MMVNRDSLVCVHFHVNFIILEKYRRLTDNARMQVSSLLFVIIA